MRSWVQHSTATAAELPGTEPSRHAAGRNILAGTDAIAAASAARRRDDRRPHGPVQPVHTTQHNTFNPCYNRTQTIYHASRLQQIPVVGKSKSWFDLNHDWITHSDLIWKIMICFTKRVIWFDLKFYDLSWNHSRSQKFFDGMHNAIVSDHSYQNHALVFICIQQCFLKPDSQNSTTEMSPPQAWINPPVLIKGYGTRETKPETK